jgi:hypothetical protein
VYDVADLVVFLNATGKQFDDYTPLTGICTSIDSPTWEDNGGSGTIRAESLGTVKVLVITSTLATHRKIAALLMEIREVAAKKSGGEGWPHRLQATVAPLGGAGMMATGAQASANHPPASPQGSAADKPK